MITTPWDSDQQRVLGLAPTASATVIGAPGTGKTAVLVERVVRLLTGENAPLRPEQLLVLTPSRASATRLRDVLGARVQAATPGALARSVGSFAFQVVRTDSALRGAGAPELLTGAEQDRILALLIEGDAADGRIAWPDHLGPTVRASPEFRSELRAFLDGAVEHDLSRDELRALRGGEWAPVADLLGEYAGVVQSMRTDAHDAAELASAAARILREEPRLPGIDELRAVVVDDAQELTRGGIAIVEALRARGVAVLAAGDPDIASGAFRGITPDLFDGLVSLLGDVHVLGTPHRSGEQITWLVRRLTQLIGAGGRVDHRRAPGPAPESWSDVSVVRASSPADELDQLAGRLRELHLLHGVPWGAMAVIAHDTRQIVTLDAELAARDVPTRASGVPRPLGSERAVRQLVEIVRLALTPMPERSDDALIDALRSPYGGFDGVGVRRLRSGLRHAELAEAGSRSARELLREGFAHPVLFASLDTPEGRAADRFATTLREAERMAGEGATVHELLWHVWDRARGLRGGRLSEAWRRDAIGTGPTAAESARALDGLVALFAAAKRSIERRPHDPPSRFIHDVLDSDVPEDSLSSPERGATVTLLTPANAISTQFEVVAIAGVQDGVWPNTRLRGGLLGSWRLDEEVRAMRTRRAPADPSTLDRRRGVLHDELRLFVRAVSRSSGRVIVSAVDDDDASPSALFGYLPPPDAPEAVPAHPLTLRGLVARHRRALTEGGDADPHAASQLRVLATHGVPGADPDEWFGVRPPSTDAPLADLETEHVRVSPSKIADFEECGTAWAIRALGGDTVTSPSAGIGTMLHAALERVPDGGVDAMKAVIDERWGELDFETAWQAARERRRIDEYVERLDAYLAEVRAEGGHVVATEAGFRLAIRVATGEVVSGDDVFAPGSAVIRGFVDRVESYPRGSGDHPAARRAARGSKKWTPMSAADEGSAERVVVVDLKSGKYEDRTNDPSVAADAQLASYQLAVEQGLIEGADPRALAGARLAVVSQGIETSPYRVAHQPTLAGEARDVFIARVAEAARGMSAASFLASVDTHCREAHTPPICRIHALGAVSA